MTRRIIKYVAVFLFSSCYLTGIGQTLLGSSAMRKPKVYERPRVDVTDRAYAVEESRSSQLWVVWCDRAGVRTSNGSVLGLMQKFWVVDENEREIHIVEYNAAKYNRGLNEFREEPDDFGWVQKSQMLLWSEGLRSAKQGFRVKAMTVSTPETILASGIEELNEAGRKMAFYDSPTSKEMNDKDSPLFNIFYLFKESNERYLLGRRDNISTGEAGDYIYGWVDKSSVTTWDLRQALEPNWETSAVQERNTARVLPAAFRSASEAEAYANGSITNSASLWSRAYEKREQPDWKRFPIFEQNENIIKTGVISGLFSESGDKQQEITAEEYATYQKLYNRQREKARNINIVFAIDGTRSMAAEIDATRRAVTRSLGELTDSENNYRIGVVVYRDFEEEEQYQFEKYSLTNDKNQIISDLGFIEEYHQNDKSTAEALFTGLYHSARMFNYREDETNVIILIGDAGANEENDIELENFDKLKRMMGNYSISLFAIQAKHGNHESYDDFIFQIRELILESAAKAIQVTNQEWAGTNLISFDEELAFEQDKSSEVSTLYRLNERSSNVQGGIQYVETGQVIEPEQVQSEIVGLIDMVDQSNNMLLNAMEGIMNSVVGPGGIAGAEEILTPQMADFLSKAGFDNSMMKTLMEKKYQFLFESYVPLKTNTLEYPLFKYVLFLDQGELDDLTNDLSELVELDLTGYQKRQQLSDVWFEILSLNYGVKDVNEIRDKKISELVELVTGLPAQTELLTKYKFEDLRDQVKVSNQEFNELLFAIKSKLDLLRQINGNNDHMFVSNDASFYWIPQEFFP
ncbi:MAG: VWA domain-containing protein [Cyclobacteriaceae bacterium]